MKKSKKILIGLFLLTSFFSFSQSTINDDKAHRRYWYYRTRFINDFIKMGKNQGECIVLAERNEINGAGTNLAKVGPDQIDLSNMYLATLALEYKLLTRANQNTDETIKEIYQLLYTLNRLDLQMEVVYNAYDNLNQPTILQTQNGVLPTNTNVNDMNGYMMREDLNHDFIASNLGHFNYELQLAGYNGANLNNLPDPIIINNQPAPATSYGSFTGLPHVNNPDGDSKFEQCVNHPLAPINNPLGGPPLYPNYAYEVSLVHDKYYSMLAAFMFIVKYIPSNTYYYENGIAQTFQDGTSGIKEQAIAITNRFDQYVRGNTFALNAVPNDWLIKQPDGSNIGPFAGALMSPYSFSTCRAMCHINNGWPWAWTDNCTNYMDQTALSSGLIGYNGLGSVFGPSMDVAVFVAWNQVISNYPIVVGGAFPMPCWLQMATNTNHWNIEWAELAREVLFETHPIQASISTVENPIDDAPCNGPYNFSNANSNIWSVWPNTDWSAQDRTEHADSQGNNSPFQGNYPGVDFMFLHNLFYEYLNQQNVPGKYDYAYNLMDNYDSQTWPLAINPPGNLPTFLVGVNSNTSTDKQALIKVFQNLSSRAQIYATSSPAAPSNVIPSYVEYRAGKEIALLPEDGSQPGFSAEGGTEFSAYISRYLCTYGDPYGQGMRGVPNASVNDYESDGMNTEVPIHYVEHPKSDSDLYTGGYPEGSSVSMSQFHDNTIEQPKKMQVAPNPNQGAFSITISGVEENEEFNLMIIDMKGSVIYESDNFNSKEIDLKNYPKGIYFVKLKSNKGFEESKKISINE
jgi:hypothetical protein